jgi:hypothetical protein
MTTRTKIDSGRVLVRAYGIVLIVCAVFYLLTVVAYIVSFHNNVRLTISGLFYLMAFYAAFRD